MVTARQRAMGGGNEALLSGVHAAVAVDVAITVVATVAIGISVRARLGQPADAARNA